MSPPGWREQVDRLLREATVNRERGDALRRIGDGDQSRKSYLVGVSALDRAIAILSDREWNHLSEFENTATLPPDQQQLASELVEAWGARGGLLRRAENAHAALESYSAGAQLEKYFVPSSTYNRTNAIKYALLTGSRQLNEVKPEIDDLQTLLTDQLSGDGGQSDSGWSWADLGDTRALLGDVAGAERAYRTFVEKAASNAPNSTLDVLASILLKLEENQDPAVDSVRQSLVALKERLAP